VDKSHNLYLLRSVTQKLVLGSFNNIIHDNEPLVFLREKVAFASPKITRWPMRSSGCAS